MSFTAQIGQLTGSASTNDATTIAQGLENAQLEVIQKVSQVQPDMLNLMSSDVTSTSNIDSDNNFYFSRGLSKEESAIATKIIKEMVVSIEGIERALHIDDIDNLPANEENNRLKNMVDRLKSPDVYVLLKKNWIWKSVYGSSHGTHHSYDSHVPLIISRNKSKNKLVDLKAYTVDAPVTIAEILDIDYPKSVDGKPLEVNFIYK